MVIIDFTKNVEQRKKEFHELVYLKKLLKSTLAQKSRLIKKKNDPSYDNERFANDDAILNICSKLVKLGCITIEMFEGITKKKEQIQIL